MKKVVKRHAKVGSGLFIPEEILAKADIITEDIEMELEEKEIRIHPTENKKRRAFSLNSPLWKCVGFAKTEGVSGRDHDKYIYDEER